jgi:hypothetical protein
MEMTARDKYLEIIKLFIDLSENEISWSKECGFAKKLTAAYPDINFWRFINRNTNLTLKLPSLAWFIGPRGRQCLKEQYKKFSVGLETRMVYHIGDEKVVEIPEIKRDSLLDFINT